MDGGLLDDDEQYPPWYPLALGDGQLGIWEIETEGNAPGMSEQ